MNRVEVMKACLAEAGYPDLSVYACPPGDACFAYCSGHWPHVSGQISAEAERIVHRAYVLMGCPDTPECFECWQSTCEVHASTP